MNIFPQSRDIEFEHITSKEGLLQSTINCIYQDSRGFMWFGTEEGLSMYDGYTFYNYQYELGNENSLRANSIQSINEDSNGILWISTWGGGLARLDVSDGKFTNFLNIRENENSISSNIVFDVKESLRDSSILWVATMDGLNKFNRNEKIFERIKFPEYNGEEISQNFRSLYIDHDSTLWIGSIGSGLIKYNDAAKSFKFFKIKRKNREIHEDNCITYIFSNSDSLFWLGTFGGGIKKFNKLTGRVEHLPERENGNISLRDNYIRTIIEYESGELWIATRDGINILETKTSKFNVLRNDISNPASLSNNFIMSIFKDRSDIVWIGTFGGALNKYDKYKQKFIRYRNNPNKQNSLSNNYVTSIFEDEKQDLWIGTWQGGLNKYNKSENIFHHFTAGDNSIISDNSIYAIQKDNSGNFWFGTSNGLDMIKADGKKFHFINNPNDDSSITNNVIRSLTLDSKGNLWIGTDNGLNRYSKGKFIRYDFNDVNLHGSNRIFDLLESNDGVFFVGTGNGFIKFNESTGEFKRFNYNSKNSSSISHNWIWVIHRDNSGNIWLGTRGGGLNKFNIQSGEFERFTEDQGLPSNVIVGILEDSDNNLWLSTQKGISKFNLENHSIRNYTPNDNLQGFEFNGGAFCKAKDGIMYFGGTNGFNEFDPKYMYDNPNIPNIVISDMQILNKSVTIGEDSPLKKKITFTQSIELSYYQNSFSFEFSALNFSYSEDNQYAYILEGFDKDWIYSGNRRFASYTNIDPGDYVFRVKGSNNDGVWNEKSTSLAIAILPPFWETWWFIMSVSAFVLSLIILIPLYHIKNLVKMERYRLKIAADLHDDIGTRLTEISMLTDMLVYQEKGFTENQLTTISKVGSTARSLIDSMRDIVWLINPKRDSLYELILKIKDTYEEILMHKNIDFTVGDFTHLQRIKTPMDYRKNLYLILKEGLNNSIKYSGCSKISIDCRLKGKKIELTVKDNGKGFNPVKERSQSGIRNMLQRAELLKGKIEIESNESIGTIIKFTGEI